MDHAENQEQSPTANEAKKSYEAPQAVELGSVTEMTQFTITNGGGSNVVSL